MTTPLAERRFGTQSALVIGACLLAISLGFYLLFEDLHESGEAGKGTPLARLERREADVKRKASASYAWSEARAGQNLFRKDSVQTGSGGGATLRFDDGSVVELGENSLVVVDDLTQVELSFVRGSFIVHKASGDSRVSVGKDGKAKIEKLPVTLLEPSPHARFFVASGQNQDVPFSWKVSNSSAEQAEATPRRLEISRHRAFPQKGLTTRKLDESVARDKLKIALASGLYYWRLTDGETPLSEVGRFRVIEASAPKPLHPAADEPFFGYANETAVQFRWKPLSEQEIAAEDSGSARFELQIARDPDFREIAIRKPVSASAGQVTIKEIPEGRYFWRLRGIYDNVEALGASETFRASRLKKPTVTLVSPAENANTEKLPQVRFAWLSDAEGLKYHWELETLSGKSILRSQVAALAEVWKRPAPGSFRWRVSAYHGNQLVTQTDWRTLSVIEGAKLTLREPAADAKISYWDPPPELAFAWNPDPLVTSSGDYSYQFLLSKDREFRNLALRRTLPAPAYRSGRDPIDDGVFFWRVEVMDRAGQILKTSETRKLTKSIHPPLPPAEVLSPASGTVYELIENDVTPELTWKPVPEAQAYEVTVFPNQNSGPGPQRPVFRTVTASPRAEVRALPVGSYRWSVRAIDRIKRPGEASAARTFTLTYGEPLAAPVVKDEEVQ